MKEEERRTFLERFYFKLKEEYLEGIPKFDSDETIKIERVNIVDITSDRGLKFAEYPHEIQNIRERHLFKRGAI